MNKTDITTPLLNYFSGFLSKDKPDFETIIKPLMDQYQQDLLVLMKTRQATTSSKEYHLQKLGKQKYCTILSYRNWVWEGENWRVYCSKRGASFEVLEGLTMAQAWDAWQDYFEKII